MQKYQTQSLFTEETVETYCHHVIRVAFESAADTEFDYLMPDEFWPIETGQRVEVPFGKKNKLEIGFCVEADVNNKEHKVVRKEKAFKLKRVVRIIDKEPLLNAELMELTRWISDYYICPLGQVLTAMVPAAVKKAIGARTEKYIYLAISAVNVADNIRQLKGKKQRQIIEHLQRNAVFNSDKALELQKLLSEIGCGQEPVKKLAQKCIIKIVEKTVLKSLPAIPKGMSIKAEKVVLNEDQKKALAHFFAQIESGKFGVTVLHGVTDSGKTELYIRAIEEVLRKGKSAIVLLPEIALTTQTVQRFSSRFRKIAVMHSGLTAAQRNVQWQKIKSGDADVVIGARSAVFAPLPRLGLIVVDEEHEPSYKQETSPRYNGRDVAIKRAQLANALCILGSATPSLETLSNARDKKYFSLVCLPRRVMELPMPEMRLVDLQKTNFVRKGIDLISEPLEKGLSETLAKKEQAILLLNRRGYSNFIFCPSCKHTLHCRNCDVTLTFHRAGLTGRNRMQTITGKHITSGYAECHYCLAQSLVPEKCPLCGTRMVMIGLGSQRLEEELAFKFQKARISRVDSDSMASGDYYKVLKDFGEGRIDILAGTQMIAKGLHFPNVTLVGIISADTCLFLPDFRANERTFQLISQVAGRAGRSVKKGTVFVQTFLPNQPAIKFALAGDFEGFIKEELKHRKACNLPPFWRLAVVTLRDRTFDKLEIACNRMREEIDRVVQQEQLKAIIRGPMPAVISRIQSFHRMQIIIQTPQAVVLRELFNGLRVRQRQIRPAVKIAIDIDPVNLL
ncbi:MAG: primosomal protein N' [Planctomycetes bacterium RBG_13_44_8b]|nr:MAG: primosomal protein N' [Planctomycetes bacterium RBG_13_44_8b]